MTLRTPPRPRSLAFAATVLALVAGMLVQACTNREIIGVVVSSVTVGPASASLVEGDSLQFTAVVRDEDGNILPADGQVEWSTDQPTLLSVSSSGMVRALQSGTAHVRAEF